MQQKTDVTSGEGKCGCDDIVSVGESKSHTSLPQKNHHGYFVYFWERSKKKDVISREFRKIATSQEANFRRTHKNIKVKKETQNMYSATEY